MENKIYETLADLQTTDNYFRNNRKWQLDCNANLARGIEHNQLAG
jgi:hypothetical protein